MHRSCDWPLSNRGDIYVLDLRERRKRRSNSLEHGSMEKHKIIRKREVQDCRFGSFDP